jgi:steroid 5-alpha reductase family enzyme
MKMEFINFINLIYIEYVRFLPKLLKNLIEYNIFFGVFISHILLFAFLLKRANQSNFIDSIFTVNTFLMTTMFSLIMTCIYEEGDPKYTMLIVFTIFLWSIRSYYSQVSRVSLGIIEAQEYNEYIEELEEIKNLKGKK